MALIKCKECGKEFSDTARVCPHCGYNPFFQQEQRINTSKKKSKIVAGLLCFFLWGIGAHEFYLGSAKRAVIWIIAGIIVSIIAVFIPVLYLLFLIPLICSIKLFIMPQEEFDWKYNSVDSPESRWGCLVTAIIFGFILPFIFGILAAIAMPQYFRAVEKARASEVLSLISNISNSQQRYNLKTKQYASLFDKLDLNLIDKYGKPVASVPSFESNNFTITLKGMGPDAYVEADRKDGKFLYKIRKFYQSGKVQCVEDQNTGYSPVCRSLGLGAE